MHLRFAWLESGPLLVNIHRAHWCTAHEVNLKVFTFFSLFSGKFSGKVGKRLPKLQSQTHKGQFVKNLGFFVVKLWLANLRFVFFRFRGISCYGKSKLSDIRSAKIQIVLTYDRLMTRKNSVRMIRLGHHIKKFMKALYTGRKVLLFLVTAVFCQLPKELRKLSLSEELRTVLRAFLDLISIFSNECNRRSNECVLINRVWVS